MLPRRARRACRVAACSAVLLVAAPGCGGGGDGPSKAAYYGAIDRFCSDVATAAKHVTNDTSAVQADKQATRATVVKVVTASLRTFATSTQTALDQLERTDVPAPFETYQRGTSSGFRRFVTTLRSTATAARRDGASALSQLGPRLSAVKLPDPPPQITQHAKACASFTPKG